MTRSELISRIKSKGNATTELAMMSWLKQNKITGWRRHVKVLGIDVDFYFPVTRTCLFVDGCFWHGCPQHMTFKKAMRLPRRDEKQEQSLKQQGYHVWRIWEHQTIKGDI